MCLGVFKFNYMPRKQLIDLDFFEAASGVCERGDPGLDRLGLGAVRFLNCKGKHRNEAFEVFLVLLV